jgi:RsiW-degrading membrane proteinase PrsW (M82 family)
MGISGKARNNAAGWLALLFFCGVLLALFVAVKMQSLIGVAATLAIFGAAFWFFARRGRKYYEAHPQEAAEDARRRTILMQEAERRSNNDFKSKLIGVGIAAGVIILVQAVRKFTPVFATLPREEQLTWLFLGVVIAIVAINVVIGIVKKRRALSARP